MAEKLLPPVVARLIADTREFTAKMDEAERKMKTVGAEGAGMGGKMKTGFLGVAAVGGVAATVAIGVAGEMVKMGQDFQTAQTTLKNTGSLTTDAMKQIGDAFLSTAGTSEFTATQMSNALGGVIGKLNLLNNGTISTTQAIDFTSAASELATAKQIDLADATAATSDIMQAFQMPLSQTADATNQLYVASSLTGMPIADLTQKFTKMHAKLGVAIPSLNDMDALMVDMTSHGVGQGRVLQSATQAINKMLDPSKKQAAAFQQLTGASVYQNGQFIGMRNVLTQLQPAFAGMTTQQKLSNAAMIFGKGSAQAMVSLISAGGAAYDKAAGQVKHHTSVTKAASDQASTLAGQVKTFKAAISDLGIQAGVQLLPTATTVAKWGAKTLVPWLKNLFTGIGTDKHGKPADFAHSTGWSKTATIARNVPGGAVELVKGIGDGILGVLGAVAGGGFFTGGNKSFGAAGRAFGAFGHRGATMGDLPTPKAPKLPPEGAYGAAGKPVHLAPGGAVDIHNKVQVDSIAREFSLLSIKAPVNTHVKSMPKSHVSVKVNGKVVVKK